MANPVLTSFFHTPTPVFTAAIFLRLILLLYGAYQDAWSSVKYTDIDYLVFTDAARLVAQGASPYARATYRYTPLVAWLLQPTSWTTRTLGPGFWFQSGKVLFAAGDVVTGWMVWRVLVTRRGMEEGRALRYAGLWLLNPMVANISTRGSSEGLLAVIVVALLWAAEERRVQLAGLLLGLGVHVKIYPFVYAASVWWWLGGRKEESSVGGEKGVVGMVGMVKRVLTKERWDLAQFSLAAFMGLNTVMYLRYGVPFIEHSYAYHLTRIDHRHNFSVYNTALHLSSLSTQTNQIRVESLAFIPQLLLSVGVIPFLLAKKDLASTMLAQTFAFVTFNKVCTSQYFLWYMVFLPFYLPDSSLMRKPVLGITALVLWILGQAFWLQQAYGLEFLGQSTFVPGLWVASMFFFLVNCWILGIIVDDIRSRPDSIPSSNEEKAKKMK